MYCLYRFIKVERRENETKNRFYRNYPTYMCCSQQYYFIKCINIARELDVYFVFALVDIPVRFVNAFIKRVAFS